MLDWCSRERRRRHPVRRRQLGRRRRRAAVRRARRRRSTSARLDRVLEIDPTSRAARIQAGVLGPHLEDQLRPHGLTLRHFPQSFAFSTLGGWLATRAGGHFATLYTHIDDLTESLRVVTPVGVSESRRLPGSGRRAVAGPAVPRLRGHARRDHRGVDAAAGPAAVAGHGLGRPSTTYADAVAATRTIAQSGLHPANCRLLDPAEAFLNAGTSVTGGLLVLGVRVRRPPGRPVARPGASRSPATTAASGSPYASRDERREPPGRRRGDLALVVPADALPARRGGPARDGRRDVRDRLHLGPVRGGARRDHHRGAGRRRAGLRRRAW